MKKITYYLPEKGLVGLFFILLFFLSSATAQVGIGTTSPATGSALQIDSTTGALVPPRMTNAQMNAIPNPLEGSIVYNTNFSALFLYSSGTWNNITRPDLPSIVMSKDWGENNDNNLVQTHTNIYYKFPLTQEEVRSNEPNFFEVIGPGTIKIKRSGNYMITAGFSVNMLPTGGHKYIIGVYNGSSLIGYLVRGNVVMQNDDEFGTSGVMMLPFAANQIISLQYVMNNDGVPLDARFFKIGIVKI
ncbi:hypothetical protein QRD02_10400 [Aequorivita sp. SDUM287046]|uniref:Uncharacterized protein n=1 Tax=Aequorivita aurantiaca TaxID=3053356 RepID=A0ABT8DJ00_9FLAO|nr:hypothetical protein [Aequorivita aurantiaca]MDN3724794.1 hypothetical protein [Aequorivita aurantiaca]